MFFQSNPQEHEVSPCAVDAAISRVAVAAQIRCIACENECGLAYYRNSVSLSNVNLCIRDYEDGAVHSRLVQSSAKLTTLRL